MDMDEQRCFNRMVSSSSRGKAPRDYNEDFNEEDVWAANIMKEREVSSNWKAKRALEFYSSSSSSSACRRFPTVPFPKVIPRVNSVGHHLQQQVIITHRQSSAPLRIKDWSNVVDGTTTGAADAWSGNNNYNGYNNYSAVNEINVVDDDEDGEEMVPPHEFIARRVARSPVVSCSMCEGVGRTLKGRDLSKLRNAILTKTGFLE